MGNDDWYRNQNWNKNIENEFFIKLNRARNQRDQYIVIQALTLSRSYPEVSLRLIDLYFETRKDDFEQVRALLARAESFLELEDISKYIDTCHEIMLRENEFPNHKTNTYVQYPYNVATRKLQSEYEYASDILEQNFDQLTFPLDLFMWYAAKAIIEQSAEYAKKALEAAEVKLSGFRFHQDVGLVGKEHKNTIKTLVAINT